MFARSSGRSRKRFSVSAVAAALIVMITPLPALAAPPVFQLDNSGGTAATTGARNGFVFGGQLSSDGETKVTDASSFMPVTGMLDAPSYFNPDDGRYYSLTYNPPHGIPLSFAIAHGTGGTSPAWTGNSQLIHTQNGNGRDGDDGFNVLSGDFDSGNSSAFTVIAQTIAGAPVDDTHYRGPGTLTVRGTIAFAGGPRLEVTHEYSALLGTTKNWLKAETTVRNLSATPAANVNFWIGTADDHIGGNDNVAKVKGFVTRVEDRSGFSPRCDGSSNAVLTYVGAAAAGSYVLLYSQSSGAQSILSENINNWNTTIVGLEPAASDFEVGTEDGDFDGIADGNDGSYGLYLPIGGLAANGGAGDSKKVTWYYEGGALGFIPPANCGDGAQQTAVSTLAVECTPDPTVPGAVVTCEVTGGDPGIDILWRASTDSVFASTGVTLDEFGRGTFTFLAPRGSAGQTIAVSLVEWDVADTVLVTGTPVPNRLPAGGGPDGPAPALLVAGLVLASALGLSRLRRGSMAS